ncbi:NAD-dependent epimerase/dehydratase family protein [Oceanibacterium hippocampi]|uniref:NAD dependent epimerase/dehydratase family protein n=1 Tax=Oceanibacterium hippocampi TaxID=745714 RepID=A0A1Y5RBK4_9PROT|nr:NAD(P)H-binding protein [Oceanibacterium hippocampi]SLN10876.1 NAD dependent epimerase/dehydratase family protein [Oceanibacterium hippocampi]
MPDTILIIGATGGLGGAATAVFHRHGWRVRALHRDPVAAQRKRPDLEHVDWRAGDAMTAADVRRSAAGAAVVLHAANPPGYRNWRKLALPMLAHAADAAEAEGARLILPGNVYNFGPDAWPVLAEDAPQHPATRKGRIRVEMEADLEARSARGLRVLIVRAGDFFGADAPASWFQTVMVKPGKPLRSVTYPGLPEVGHAWAYLPDLAETMVRLAEREDALPRFARFHFGGHYLERGIGLAETIRETAGRPEAPIRRFPWPLVTLLSPVVPLFREIGEMRYLWQEAIRLDNRSLLSFLGSEPHTPLADAVRTSLAGLGCLEAR